MDNLNRVLGTIKLVDPDLPIPELIVSAYDVDPDKRLEKFLPGSGYTYAADFWQNFTGDRLGSVATDLQGRFEIEYDDAAFRARGEQTRPALALVVTAPEVAGVEPCPLVLHVTCTIRQNAARLETFIIRLSRELLESAGIPIPDLSPSQTKDPDVILKEISVADEDQAKISAGIQAIAGQRVQRKRELRAAFEEKVKSHRAQRRIEKTAKTVRGRKR